MRNLACGVVFIAAFSVHAQAELLALSCNGHRNDNNDPLLFSIMIDPAKHQVLDIGSGPGVITDQFSERMITALHNGPALQQILIIDRVTGQFSLTWVHLRGTEAVGGENYEGTCSVAQRKF